MEWLVFILLVGFLIAWAEVEGKKKRIKEAFEPFTPKAHVNPNSENSAHWATDEELRKGGLFK